MNDGQIRASILEETYAVMKKKGSIKGAIFPLFEKTKDWGVEEKDINRNVEVLKGKGLIEKIGVKLVGSSVSPVTRITIEGVNEYESKHGAGDFGKHGCPADWPR